MITNNTVNLKNIINIINTSVKVPDVDSRGYSIDLYSPSDFLIKRDSIVSINSGISLNIPEGYMALLLPTAKLSLNSGFHVLASFIPCTYTNEILISLSQHSLDSMVIEKNQHIAQLVLIPVLKINE